MSTPTKAQRLAAGVTHELERAQAALLSVHGSTNDPTIAKGVESLRRKMRTLIERAKLIEEHVSQLDIGV